MKKFKKALLTVLSAILLVAISVGATIAYLTDDVDVVTNTFTVGNVSFNDDEALAGGLDEATTDIYGAADEDTYVEYKDWANYERTTENTYKLVPFHVYIKDPTVHLKAGSESCYVFVKVTNGIEGLEAKEDDYTVNGAEYTYQNIKTQITTKDNNVVDDIAWTQLADANGFAVDNIYWIKVDGTNEDGTLKGDTLDAEGNVTEEGQQLDFVVFTEFMTASDLDDLLAKDENDNVRVNDDNKYVDAEGNVIDIQIDAYAIQSDGFADAYTAWMANQHTFDN